MGDATLYKALGEAVAVRRNGLKLTQAELAARVGMSRASIANIERGRQKTLLHQVYKLAEALRLPNISEILPSSTKIVSEPEFEIQKSSDQITQKQKALAEDAIASALSKLTRVAP